MIKKIKKLVLPLMIFCVIIMQAGCKNNDPKSKSNPTNVVITVAGQNIKLTEIDAEKDTLIYRKIDEDIDFEMEKSIFLPLLKDKKSSPINLDSLIEITFADTEQIDSVILYDHLLQENGTSYFNRMILEYELELNDNKATFELTQHISCVFASSTEFLKDGSIRGFRLIMRSGGNISEYAFVIYVK